MSDYAATFVRIARLREVEIRLAALTETVADVRNETDDPRIRDAALHLDTARNHLLAYIKREEAREEPPLCYCAACVEANGGFPGHHADLAAKGPA